MIIHYNFSIRGKSHFAANKPCQDSNCVNVTSSGLNIAVVADGVGSAENSEYGSRIAADTAVGHLSSVLSGISPERVAIAELKRAFELAFAAVCKRADSDGKSLSSYDTTLSVVVYDGDTCVYGHSGDGAIVGLTDEGDCVEITTPQKGEDAVSVMPLRAGASYWEFGVYEKSLSSVILVTDGMRDLLCPSLLSRADNNVYVPAAVFFADPYLWSKSRHKKKLETVVERFTEDDAGYDSDEFFDRLEEIYRYRIPGINEDVLMNFKKNSLAPDLMDRVEDDKTVVGLINASKNPAAKDLSYYMEPDWIKYKKLRDDVLYGKTSPEPFGGKGSPHNDLKEKPGEVTEENPPTEKNRSKNKYIIPLIAAGVAAAAVAIAVGVAPSKSESPNDTTVASSSEPNTNSGDAGESVAEAESTVTEGTSANTTDDTESRVKEDITNVTTTTKVAKITQESNENIENDGERTNTGVSEYTDFLKKKADEYKSDIYYAEYDVDKDGLIEIFLEKERKYYKYDKEKGKVKQFSGHLSGTIKDNFLNHEYKIFKYSDGSR